MTRTVLLYSPRPPAALDYERPLAANGWRVVRSTTVAGCVAWIEAGVDVAVLDDPPWELCRGVVAALDAGSRTVPRIWVSSWSSAPSLAGKLGVDALLLDPRDVGAVVAEVARLLAGTPPVATILPLPRAGSRRATTTPELHPRNDREHDDDADGAA